MKEITSPSNELVKSLKALKPSPEAFLVEGYHLVEMAAQSSCLDLLLFASEEVPPFEAKEKIKVSKAVIEKLSRNVTPEPIIGVCHKNNEPDFKSGGRVLILDRVQDPSNVGAILRNALAFGFKEVIFLEGTASPFNHKSLMASQGAIFPLHLSFQNEVEALKGLHDRNIKVYATALEGGKPLETYPFKKEDGMAFILGNEGKGVSDYLLKNADEKLYIAMEGIDSLNVAVASGILLHALYVL